MRERDDRWHDQRLMDLLTVFALAVVICSALYAVHEHHPTIIETSLIVPSQSVHW